MRSATGVFITLILVLGFVSSPSAHAQGRTCERVFDHRIFITLPAGEIELTDPDAIETFKSAERLQSALKLKGSARKAAIEEMYQPKPRARWEKALVFGNYAMAAITAHQLILRFAEQPQHLITALVSVPLAFFTADFMSSLFHKYFDSYQKADSSVLGDAAKSFRIHHDLPENMNQFSYLENVTPYSKLMAPLYASVMMASPLMANTNLATAAGTSALLSLVLFSNGNEIHVQAHRGKKASPWIKPLQWSRLVLSKEVHDRHHKIPVETDYGIINGWSNPVTRKAWKHIDWIFWKLAKRMPENWIDHPRTIPDSVLKELSQDISRLPQDVLISLRDPKNRDPRMSDIVRLYLERQNEEESPR